MLPMKKLMPWVLLLLIIILSIALLEICYSFREGNAGSGSAPFYWGNQAASNDAGWVGNTNASGAPLPNVQLDVKAHKLWNNVYVFPNSGKIVLLYGSNTGGDGTGKIEYMHIIKRGFNTSNGDEIVVTTTTGTPIDPTGEYVPLYGNWYTLPRPIDDYLSNTNTQVFYVQNNVDSYIHVLDLNSSTPHYGFYVTEGVVSNRSNSEKGYQDMTVDAEKPLPTSFQSKLVTNETIQNAITDTAANANTANNIPLVKIDSAYQIFPNVYFNISNGDLYIKKKLTMTKTVNGDTEDVDYFTLDRYKRTGVSIQEPSQGTLNANTDSFIVKDVDGGNLVVYVSNGINTIIMILHKESDGHYTLPRTRRFNRNGIVTSETSEYDESEEEQSGHEHQEEDTPGEGSDGVNDMAQMIDISNNVSDYYKWYWYWNSSGSLPVHFSEDYMLKTQMVPPVCPSCPTCPKQGCCTNCGGNGGAGAVDEDGKSVDKNTDGAGRPLGDAYSKTLDTGSDLLKSGGSGAVGLTKDTLGLGKDAVTGTVGLGKDAVTGTVGLGKDAVTGTIGLGKDAISGTADFIGGLGSGPTNVNQGNMNTTGYGQTSLNQYGQMGVPGTGSVTAATSDPYTYNGQLQRRPPSNFLPRTSDFSSFAK
jgi:hypothetical protein